MDECGCCLVCLKVEGEACGGLAYHIGHCDSGLYCNITGPYRPDPIGKCDRLQSDGASGNIRDTVPHRVPERNITIRVTIPPSFVKPKLTYKAASTMVTTATSMVTAPTSKTSLTTTLRPALTAKHINITNRTANVVKKLIKIGLLTNGSTTHVHRFLKGQRNNTGVNKKYISTEKSTVDTTPVVIFLVVSSLIMIGVLAIVLILEKIASKSRDTVPNAT